MSTNLGVGIYTIRQAAGLIRTAGKPGTTTDYVYRLVSGYTRHPLVSPHLSVTEGRIGITFLDLMELYFIRAYREVGVSMQHIRSAVPKLREMLETEHPFAKKRILTDTRRLFLEVKHSATHPDSIHKIIDVIKEQHNITEFVRPILKQVDFDEYELASQWWPLGKDRHVVLDPKRSFGKPIIAPHSIETSVLYNLFLAENQNTKRVAHWYEIDEKLVTNAVAFEERFRAEAKAA